MLKYMLLAAGVLLCGCGEDMSGGKDVVVSTGYEAANIDNTMYISDKYSGKDPHGMLVSMGQACKMWAGAIPKSQTLTPTGNPVQNYYFRFKIIQRSIEQTNKDCYALSGVKDAKACTEHFDNGCISHLSPNQSDDIWGWECGACFTPALN